MIISDKNKYIFIAVPKTGTTSMSLFLAENDPTAVRNIIQVDGQDCEVHEHISARELRRKMGDRFDEYTSFGFVRNPFSKLLSSYFFYRHGRAAKKVETGEQIFSVRLRVIFAKMLPFSIWALLYPFRSCRSYLANEQDELLVDHVGYFENLGEDFEKILGQLNIEGGSLQLPHLNKTKHDEFAAYVGNGLLKKILTSKVERDLSSFYREEDASD